MPRKNKQITTKKQLEDLAKGQRGIKDANKKIIKKLQSLKKKLVDEKKEDATRQAEVLKTLSNLAKGLEKFDATAKELMNGEGFCAAPEWKNQNMEKLECEKCSELEMIIDNLECDKRRIKSESEKQIAKIEQEAEEALDDVEKEHMSQYLSLEAAKKALEEQLELREEESKMLEVALAEGLSTKVAALKAALQKAEQEKEIAIRRADRIAQDVMEFKNQAVNQAQSMVKQSLVRGKKRRKSIWENPLPKRQRSSSIRSLKRKRSSSIRPMIQTRWR